MTHTSNLLPRYDTNVSLMSFHTSTANYNYSCHSWCHYYYYYYYYYYCRHFFASTHATAILGSGSSYMVCTGGSPICYTTNHFTEDDVQTRHCFSFSMEVCDLILNPPTSAQYDTLKKQLVKRTAARHLQQLFNMHNNKQQYTIFVQLIKFKS